MNGAFKIGLSALKAVYQFLMGVPIQDYERCFQNWIVRLKSCIPGGGEYFEGQRKVKITTLRIFKKNEDK